MSDWTDYCDQAHQSLEELERKLYDEFPEILAAAESGDAPRLRLLCPRGHRILTVRLERDHNWHIHVAAAREDRFEAGIHVATPSGPCRRPKTATRSRPRTPHSCAHIASANIGANIARRDC